ncbi:PRC-barrel domain-containing protein [Pleomorphomonas sp. PLEO]|uniref:PRC-barrel domain-containing protein n=1 Tax=Pleomorphomonas sp. PLEO TaxID=3239306 RepID=UPI00351F4C6F
MLWNASKIKGYAIAASDGDVGTVSDLLFDDESWLIRWLVVETGDWLTHRRVLLPTSTLGHANERSREFSVKLTMRQVENSPDIDTERPVSRQMENNIYGYYGWSPYWGSGLYMGGGGYGSVMGAPILAPEPDTLRFENEVLEAHRRHDDPHLRSVKAVDGYHIHATDGDIGHVEDMLVEEADWSIHYLVVDTKNWWPGQKVLISPRLAKDISWADKTVALSVDRQVVKNSPVYDASTIVDRDYENQFGTYYSGSDAGPFHRRPPLNGLHP